jgi:hypothetical protein
MWLFDVLIEAFWKCNQKYYEFHFSLGDTKAVPQLRYLVTAEARVHTQVSPCGMYDGRSGNGRESFGFPLSVSFHRCSIFIHVSSGG